MGPLQRHAIVAFGGGVLLAAIAFVLVPQGSERVSEGVALAAFGAGGVMFFGVDRMLSRRGGSRAQLLAMLVDFVPEALALGALLGAGAAGGALLTLLIALQNLPEGFNAFREMRVTSAMTIPRLLGLFTALALLGPVMAWIGVAFMHDHPSLLGSIMLFAAGGILYLTFEDIALAAHAAASGTPALGAVGGFLVGFGGHLRLG